MTMSKQLAAALGMIATSLFAGPVLSLDGAALYKERACIACHGAEGRVPVMTEYPKIAGQSKEYLLGQMNDIKSGARSNAHAIAMTNVMHMISEEEMAIVAEWLSGLEY
jgi:cytochrome c